MPAPGLYIVFFRFLENAFCTELLMLMKTGLTISFVFMDHIFGGIAVHGHLGLGFCLYCLLS